MDKKFAWNFTELKNNLYIVDYDIKDDNVSTISEMRNKGLAKTKYFRTKKEAMKFLHKYQVS